jgi:pimeloyl-ACP methyl ester carboxylesterase
MKIFHFHLMSWPKLPIRVLPVDFARAYHEATPESKLQVMEKCGHVPPIECPERFVEAIAGFLKS